MKKYMLFVLCSVSAVYGQSPIYTIDEFRQALVDLPQAPINMAPPEAEMSISVNGIQYPVKEGDVIAQENKSWMVVFMPKSEIMTRAYDGLNRQVWNAKPDGQSPVSWLQTTYVRSLFLKTDDDMEKICAYSVYGVPLGSRDSPNIPLEPMQHFTSCDDKEIVIYHIKNNNGVRDAIVSALSDYFMQSDSNTTVKHPLWFLALEKLSEVGINIETIHDWRKINSYFIEPSDFTDQSFSITHHAPVRFTQPVRKRSNELNKRTFVPLELLKSRFKSAFKIVH
jgi:hypothetical protein